jgi:hypothetical protein
MDIFKLSVPRFRVDTSSFLWLTWVFILLAGLLLLTAKFPGALCDEVGIGTEMTCPKPRPLNQLEEAYAFRV